MNNSIFGFIPSVAEFREVERLHGLTPYDPVSTIQTHAYQIDPETFPLPSRSQWGYIPISDISDADNRKPSAIGFRLIAKIVTPWHVIPNQNKLAIKNVANIMTEGRYTHPEACPWEEMRDRWGLKGSVYDTAQVHVVIQARLFGKNLTYWPERSGQFLSRFNGAILPSYFDPSFRGNSPSWAKKLKTIQYYGEEVLDWAFKHENWPIIKQNTVDSWR